MTGVAAGEAKITVKTGDGNKTASCTVKVTEVVAGVSISGTAKVGETLTANLTPSAATVSYQWQKADSADGSYSNIEGATGKTYQLTEAENTKYIKVVVTGKGNYTGTATSDATEAVEAAG